MESKGFVEVTGDRYPLSGQQLPSLIPWFSKLIDAEISVAEKYQSSHPLIIPEPIINHDFLVEVRGVFEEDQIIVDPKQRLRHGHGYSQFGNVCHQTRPPGTSSRCNYLSQEGGGSHLPDLNCIEAQRLSDSFRRWNTSAKR
jgi:hypothetical protein